MVSPRALHDSESSSCDKSKGTYVFFGVLFAKMSKIQFGFGFDAHSSSQPFMHQLTVKSQQEDLH